MKKILFALSAVALLFATSCKKESINPAVDVPEGSFLATIDNGANPQNAPRINDGMGTMTTIDGDNFVIWETGDQIKINGSTYTTTSTPGNTVVFSDGNATGTTFHAFFPASIAGTDAAGTLPATQTIEFDNQGNAKVSNLPMYAYSNNNQLTFHNICAALKVNVPVACDSIVISADENIRGEFTVDATTFAAQLAGSGDNLGKSVRAVKSEGSFAAAEIAYVAIPAGTYNNFTVKFYDGASVVGQKTLASLTVAVNKVYNLNIPMELCFTYVKQGVGKTNCTIKLSKSGSPNQITIDTCTYNASTKTYTDWGSYTTFGGDIVLNNVGDKVYFRANNNGNATFSKNGISYYYFTASDTVEVSGNIMTLLSQNPTTTLTTDNVFKYLFKGMNTLKSAENLVLPATTLTNSCYSGMFYGCAGLTTAPALPATTLEINCYNNMFQGCTGLTTAPALPATTLANFCYANMFNGCTGLTTAPALPATTLAQSCYNNMFQGCTGLTTAPALPATTLVQSCYSYMFYGCTGLTAAPALPATTLVDYCYYNMFNGCTGLTTAPALAATTLANSCYANMFYGCTGLTTAPELPATTLANYCYSYMFKGCSNLTSVTMKATNVAAQSCLNSWLTNAGPSTVKTIYLDSDVYSNGQAGSGTYYSTYTTIMGTASGWTPAAAPAQ